jgi:hypothetical protein
MYDWWRDLLCALFLLVGFALGYAIAHRRTRREIVHTFNTIILNIYKLAWSGQHDKLLEFLHELCEDTPYVPDQHGGKIIRPVKKAGPYSEQEQ